MNKHTRKKYPHAVREITVWTEPEVKPVSLFDETVQRAAKAEAALAEAERRIASLEKALDNSRKVNALAIKKHLSPGPPDQSAPMDRNGFRILGARGFKTVSNGKSVYMMPPPPPRLTDEEVEQQMYNVNAENSMPYARMAESVDAADLKSASHVGLLVRSRLLAPLAALFMRRAK